jgi:ABC-type polysaccharide/polyol phosphate transport system ATPase subunit
MNVIDFANVSKAYQLGASRTSLREAIAEGTRNLLRRNEQSRNELFWAVKDVSFQVDRGEVIGIIGHNGAGKSTMLKLLSRVTHPTKGHIRTRGRMASLIELGAGFHPDLSGRENIYLNGAILGLKRAEIDSQFDSIVAFANLEKFIDTPVKRYSSGMYVRLAFAVAAHVKADLMLVDEVLSVGDINFQERSLAKMKQLRDDGATIVFISHNIPAVRSFCSRVLMMDHGKLIAQGKPNEMIDMYERVEMANYHRIAQYSTEIEDANGSNNTASGELSGPPRIENFRVFDSLGKPVTSLPFKSEINVGFNFAVPMHIQQPRFRVVFKRITDDLIAVARSHGFEDQYVLHGRGCVEGRFGDIKLAPSNYSVQVYLYEHDGYQVVAASEPYMLQITGWEEDLSDGVFKPEVDWKFELAS